MVHSTNTAHQTNLFGTELLQQLDAGRSATAIGKRAIPWSEFEQAFAQYYTPGVGRPPNPIRLMVGLELLKYLEDLVMKGLLYSLNAIPIIRLSVG